MHATKVTTIQRVRNTLAFALFCIFLGALGGAFTWAFFFLMARGLEFLWHTIPGKLSVADIPIAFYPLVLCSLGGLRIGLFQKYAGPYPDDLNTVVGTIKKEGSFPHDHVGRSFFGALLPLFFGGSIGPEAGLTGVIAGICSAIGEKLHFAGVKLTEVAGSQTAAARTAIYGAPLFGLFGTLFGYTDNPGARVETESDITFPKRQKMVVYLLAISSAFLAVLGLGKLFGGGLSMPRFSSFSLHAQDIPAIIATIALASFFGWLFHFAGYLSRRANQALKGATITKAVVAGVILGSLGCVLPFVMFAGEDQLTTLEAIWTSLTPLVLIATALLKVCATQMCLSLGWRGGHFFPLIFAGIALGYGCALLFQVDAISLVAVASAALMGAVMQKPLFTVFLLFLCFPASAAPLLIGAAALGAAIPVPNAWREK